MPLTDSLLPMKDHQMAIETGAAAGGIAAKYGLVSKLAVMFAASAVGAAFSAAYHPETRKETWWRALGAGVGGVFVGGIVLRFAAQYFDFLAPPSDMRQFWDWLLDVVIPLLFVFGGLFWGLVGMIQSLAKKIKERGADSIADKAGIK